MVSRQTIVYTAGVWDLLHIGHVRYLKRAKAFGDVLVVGVQADELVEQDKGRRPIIPHVQRMEMVEALECVDCVIPILHFDYVKYLKDLCPDVYIWTATNTKLRHIEAREYARAHNILIVTLPHEEETSTTAIRQRILEQDVKRNLVEQFLNTKGIKRSG